MSRSLGLVVLVLVVVALGAAAWFVTSVGALHDRLASHSESLALAFLGLVAVVLLAAGITAGRMYHVAGRVDKPAPKPPEDVVKAAEIQVERAEGVVSQIGDPTARGRLNEELAAIRTDRQTRRFHVVIFGTGSAGKTSLINALLGRHVGKTAPVMGTTREGQVFTQEVVGIDGTVLLTDTPGLSEIGAGGAQRESEARDLAARADLLLFVLDHDVIRSEYEPMTALARQGKRSIVVLNKQDRLVDADRDAILDKLRERLRGIVAAEDVVAVAASPRPMPVRFIGPDGTPQTMLEPQPVDIGALQARIAVVLRREGDALRAGNLLLRAHLVSKQAQDQLAQERDRKAQAVVDKFQWITAGTVFANPFPALDLIANGAVQFQMISELAGVYGVEISTAHVKMVGLQMIQMLLKLGMVEATTSLVAGLFKSSLAGYAAGGAIQAVSLAYLTHISGSTFAEYFARGQTWGDGGMQAALVRQFDLTSRAEFLQEFAKQAIDKVVHRALRTSPEAKNAK